jgi:hypothetical protein
MEVKPLPETPKIRKKRLSIFPRGYKEPQITPPPSAMARHFEHNNENPVVMEEQQQQQENQESAESFFDLGATLPTQDDGSIEAVMRRLFSAEHLNFILADHALFHRFSAFLNQYKSKLVPTLIRYLEMRKAMKAIEYANAVARQIRW